MATTTTSPSLMMIEGDRLVSFKQIIGGTDESAMVRVHANGMIYAYDLVKAATGKTDKDTETYMRDEDMERTYFKEVMIPPPPPCYLLSYTHVCMCATNHILCTHNLA